MHTEILIKGTQQDPLFRASDIGEILEMGNIRTSINDYNETEKVAVHTTDSTGRKQAITFLTEKGLYKVLFKSRKPIAENFQSWVCEIIKEIRLNGIYDLQKQLENQKTEMQILDDKKTLEYNIKLEKQRVLEREKILLKEYSTIGAIFYIIKVKTLENGQYIVKVGESGNGIKNRYNEHKGKYDECLLLDCFSVAKSRKFEKFVMDKIRLNRVTNLEGHEKENELFLIGKNLSYQTLLNIINDNINNFDEDTHQLELEIEKLKLMLELKSSGNDNALLQELIDINKQLCSRIDLLEKTVKETNEKIISSQTKVVTGFNEPLATLGPRLQKINPETLQLVKIYESISEAMKENSNIKRPTLNKAIVENTIYFGFRWLLVERDLDASIIHYIQPTKQTRPQNLGYIAQLNKEKTEIVNVYIDRKTAAHFNGFNSTSALDTPVKNFIMIKGFYYKLYDDCDENLRLIFEEKYRQPFLFKQGVGQYNIDGSLLREFACKYDCLRQLKMSDKTLRKALDNDTKYNNCYFKSLESRLKMI
jgi:prophage antirepressor-like protein